MNCGQVPARACCRIGLRSLLRPLSGCLYPLLLCLPRHLLRVELSFALGHHIRRHAVPLGRANQLDFVAIHSLGPRSFVHKKVEVAGLHHIGGRRRDWGVEADRHLNEVVTAVRRHRYDTAFVVVVNSM